jgi:hypothetical protein
MRACPVVCGHEGASIIEQIGAPSPPVRPATTQVDCPLYTLTGTKDGRDRGRNCRSRFSSPVLAFTFVLNYSETFSYRRSETSCPVALSPPARR